MKKVLINPKLLYVAGVIGLASTVAPHSLSAQGVSDIVRTLNAVINPGGTRSVWKIRHAAIISRRRSGIGGIIARAWKLPIGAGTLIPVVTMAIVALTLPTRAAFVLTGR